MTAGYRKSVRDCCAGGNVRSKLHPGRGKTDRMIMYDAPPDESSACTGGLGLANRCDGKLGEDAVSDIIGYAARNAAGNAVGDVLAGAKAHPHTLNARESQVG